MAYNKVVISGINTSELAILKEDEKIALMKEIKATGSADKAIQARERLTSELQHEPDIEEIAADIGEKRSEVVIALESISDPVSLYEPVYSDSGDTVYIMDQIGDKNDVENWIDELTIRDTIKNLSERERNIIYLRFLKGRTQVEVAGEIGISQAQVSRLEKCAINRIKNSI